MSSSVGRCVRCLEIHLYEYQRKDVSIRQRFQDLDVVLLEIRILQFDVIVFLIIHVPPCMHHLNAWSAVVAMTILSAHQVSFSNLPHATGFHRQVRNFPFDTSYSYMPSRSSRIAPKSFAMDTLALHSREQVEAMFIGMMDYGPPHTCQQVFPLRYPMGAN